MIKKPKLLVVDDERDGRGSRDGRGGRDGGDLDVAAARAGRAGVEQQVDEHLRQAGLVGQLLQLHLEQPDARTVGTAAIGRDHQPVGGRIPLPAHHIQPAADRVDRELCCVVVDADTHEILGYTECTGGDPPSYVYTNGSRTGDEISGSSIANSIVKWIQNTPNSNN